MVALARLLLESGVVLAEEGPVGGIQAFEGEGAGEREEAQRSKKVHNVIMASFSAFLTEKALSGGMVFLQCKCLQIELLYCALSHILASV